MKKKLNIKVEEVKIEKKLPSSVMYGGACGGACGGGSGSNGSSCVDSGDPTSNGFGGTQTGGGLGGLSPSLQGPLDANQIKGDRWGQPRNEPVDRALHDHWSGNPERAGG